MELKVVKVKPNQKPEQDIINIKDDIIYVKDKKGSELNLVNINNSRLKQIELKENIVTIYIEPIIDEQGIAYDLFEYPMEKNTDLKGIKIFGDYIIIGYNNKIYFSLKQQEIDSFMNSYSEM